MDRIIEKKKGLRKKHIPYVLLGLFVLVLLLWAIFGNHVSTMKRSGWIYGYVRVLALMMQPGA